MNRKNRLRKLEAHAPTKPARSPWFDPRRLSDAELEAILHAKDNKGGTVQTMAYGMLKVPGKLDDVTR